MCKDSCLFFAEKRRGLTLKKNSCYGLEYNEKIKCESCRKVSEVFRDIRTNTSIICHNCGGNPVCKTDKLWLKYIRNNPLEEKMNKITKKSEGTRILYKEKDSLASSITEGIIEEVSTEEDYVKINRTWFNVEDIVVLTELPPGNEEGRKYE